MEAKKNVRKNAGNGDGFRERKDWKKGGEGWTEDEKGRKDDGTGLKKDGTGRKKDGTGRKKDGTGRKKDGSGRMTDWKEDRTGLKSGGTDRKEDGKDWKKDEKITGQKPAIGGRKRAGKQEGGDFVSHRALSAKRGSKFEGKDGRKMGTNSQKAGMNRDNDVKPGRIERGKNSQCPVFRNCGGCQLLDMPYDMQLKKKQKELEELLKKHCPVHKIVGMKEPYHYRNKVHAVFGYRKGEAISGVYKAHSHDIVPVETCLIEDRKADEIIGTIRSMLKSFKIRTYDEDSGYGLLRHVLVKRGFATGEVMVVLVTASPVFPSKNNFTKALREKHPEITTIVQNVNERGTSMVLGDKEKTLYGKGYIEDVLCGCTFRISSKSFYQVNPVQTELLYEAAIKAAGLTGKETVIDAYCGIGTIGIIASKKAGKVIGVELNRDAVRDAMENAKRNEISNIQFYQNDAGKFMVNMAARGEKVDVVLMDPPRSGSTEEFIDSLAVMRPERVVYVSCDPVTLERDLGCFERKGYVAVGAYPFDLFPQTNHVETAVLLVRKG